MTDVDNGTPSKDQSYYSPGRLALYDMVVLQLSNSMLWHCPTSMLLDHYNKHVSGSHLDVGPGSGYYLDQCRFPTTAPSITLLDLNPSPLEHTARRINRYAPRTRTADICKPFPDFGEKFESVGLNYVLHCLPDDPGSRATVFSNLRSVLAPGGVFFGSTILGKGVVHTAVSRRVNDKYNRMGAFHNEHDSPEGLEELLRGEFSSYKIHLKGAVALFAASVT